MGGEFRSALLYATALFGGSLDNLSKNASTAPRQTKNTSTASLPTSSSPFWATCRPSGNASYADFDAAVDHMSRIGYLDKSSGLYKKLVRYHEVQGRCGENLQAIKDDGVDVAIFCAYGFPGLPITAKSYKQTDILIETEHASAGATVAYNGETLSSYKGNKSTSPPTMKLMPQPAPCRTIPGS